MSAPNGDRTRVRPAGAGRLTSTFAPNYALGLIPNGPLYLRHDRIEAIAPKSEGPSTPLCSATHLLVRRGRHSSRASPAKTPDCRDESLGGCRRDDPASQPRVPPGLPAPKWVSAPTRHPELRATDPRRVLGLGFV